MHNGNPTLFALVFFDDVFDGDLVSQRNEFAYHLNEVRVCCEEGQGVTGMGPDLVTGQKQHIISHPHINMDNHSFGVRCQNLEMFRWPLDQIVAIYGII